MLRAALLLLLVSTLTLVAGTSTQGGPLEDNPGNATTQEARLILDTAASTSADRASFYPLADAGQLLVAWQSGPSALYYAFSCTNATLEAAENSPDLENAAFLEAFSEDAIYTPKEEIPDFISPLLTGTAHGSSLFRLGLNVSNGIIPQRVILTGFGAGGGLAKLAAVWAAQAFPSAELRGITFGAPRVGDNRFIFAYSQLVDLPYDWTVPNDPRPNAPGGSPPSPALRLLLASAAQGDPSLQRFSLPYYVAALRQSVGATNQQNNLAANNANTNQVAAGQSTDSSFVSTPAPAPNRGGLGGFFSRIGDDISNAAQDVSNFFQQASQGLSAVRSIAFDGDDSNSGAIPNLNLTSEDALECPPILCKARPAAVAACQAYADGNNTITPGSVTIHADYGTVVAVGWLPANKTGVFSFRGSSSREDWLQDFETWEDDAPQSPVLSTLYPNARIHNGFLNQFQAVSDKAANDSVNIRTVLLRLSNGTEPNKLICTGHSLGAGVATICGVWAGLQFPAADIRVVTLGSPAAGNQDFVEAFREVVGNSGRFVHALDVVPALPPFVEYVQVNNSYWIQESIAPIFAERRPYYSIRDLNWDDHSCNYYKSALVNTTYITAPDSVVSGTATA